MAPELIGGGTVVPLGGHSEACASPRLARLTGAAESERSARMKLYFMQGACSLAPHVALREAGLPFTLVRFDKKTQLLEDGRPLTAVAPKGYVPVLELDSGERLTEVAVVLQYIADAKPEAGLAPRQGTFERYRLQEWLNYLATEIHKPYWPLFHDAAPVEVENARAKLGRSFAFVDAALAGRPFLLGDTFTVADCYLFTVANWAKAGGVDLAAWPALKDFRSRVRERPAVLAALKAEGLLR